MMARMASDDISPIIREKAPLILAEIKKAKSILLHCHPSPDPDSVGSALAMKLALEGMGKKVTVIRGDSRLPRAFSRFPGFGDIVDKSFGEVDLDSFDLFIALDSASPGMISQTEVPKFPLSISSIVIDHHSSNPSYGSINLIDLSASSTAFILFKLFNEWGISLTHDIATDLFIGLYTDSGGLKYPPTDYRTFAVAAELTRIAPDFAEQIFTMENSETKGSIYFRALALNSIEVFLDEHLVISAIKDSDIKLRGIMPEEMQGEGVPNILKSVIGWDIGIAMTEIEPNVIKVSMRTRDSGRFDLSKLASAIGGGGHRAASGARLKMGLDEAKKLVVSKAKELYNL